MGGYSGDSEWVDLKVGRYCCECVVPFCCEGVLGGHI